MKRETTWDFERVEKVAEAFVKPGLAREWLLRSE